MDASLWSEAGLHALVGVLVRLVELAAAIAREIRRERTELDERGQSLA